MPAPSVIPGPGFSPAAYPSSSAGVGATILGSPVASPQGFSVAFEDAALVPNPSWTWIDDPANGWHVKSVTIDRGRAYEFDRTQTGTASVYLVDTDGTFDPTNTGSAFYGNLEPMRQAAFALKNPVTSTWHTIFRGFVSDWGFVLHPTERYLMVRVDLVDALDVFANTELVTGQFGHTPVPTGSEGDVYYVEDLTTTAVQTRINNVLTECGWPTSMREIFTGNVKLSETVYPSRTSALSVMQDAADAEFPGVGNLYVAKDGVVTFHGRYARFNPTNPDYHITTWEVGDDAAAEASPTTVAPIHPPFEFHVDKEHVYSSALATPQGINDGDIAAQYVNDASSAAKYGTRTWSAENLLTAGGASSATALVETKKFATYYVQNYATPKLRINQVTVKAARPSGDKASTTWALACGVDISDRLHITTTHVKGGGFSAYYFVEGVHYDIRPMTAANHEVTLTMDVSPAALYPEGYTF